VCVCVCVCVRVCMCVCVWLLFQVLLLYYLTKYYYLWLQNATSSQQCCGILQLELSLPCQVGGCRIGLNEHRAVTLSLDSFTALCISRLKSAPVTTHICLFSSSGALIDEPLYIVVHTLRGFLCCLHAPVAHADSPKTMRAHTHTHARTRTHCPSLPHAGIAAGSPPPSAA